MEELSSKTSCLFGKFWSDIENEMKIKEGDIDLAKSIFTVLGYMTRETIADIKSKKKITELEKDFLLIKSNYNLFQEFCKTYPLLQFVDHFTAGIEAGLLQIINFLNSDVSRDESIKKKLADDAKILCKQITEADITIDVGTTGPRCRVFCPICTQGTSLGKYQNPSTGKATFTIFNFIRHFKQKHEKHVNADNNNENPMEEILNKENATPFVVDKDRIIITMEEEIKALKQMIVELQKNGTNSTSDGHNDENMILAEKDAQMNLMQSELLTLRKAIQNIQKKFSIFLMSYEKIDEKAVTVSHDSVKFYDAKNKLVYLYFDRILQEATNEEKFNAIRDRLDVFINAGNICILNHGVTGAGKSSTMFGTQVEMGILFYSAKYLITNSKIIISIIELDNGDQYDLSKGKVKLNASNAQRVVIDTYSEFESIILKSMEHRNQKATDQNSTSSRSHYFVEFHGENGNSLIFADLAGFESLKNKDDVEQTKFINATLSGLNTMLLNFSKGHIIRGDRATQLTKFLGTYLNRMDDIVITYHVMNSALKKGLEYVKEITASIQTKKHPKSISVQHNASSDRPLKIQRLG